MTSKVRHQTIWDINFACSLHVSQVFFIISVVSVLIAIYPLLVFLYEFYMNIMSKTNFNEFASWISSFENIVFHNITAKRRVNLRFYTTDYNKIVKEEASYIKCKLHVVLTIEQLIFKHFSSFTFIILQEGNTFVHNFGRGWFVHIRRVNDQILETWTLSQNYYKNYTICHTIQTVVDWRPQLVQIVCSKIGNFTKSCK